jgi:hypothetical protein
LFLSNRISHHFEDAHRRWKHRSDTAGQHRPWTCATCDEPDRRSSADNTQEESLDLHRATSYTY